MTRQAFLLMLLIASCPGVLHASNCADDAAKYAELNRTIIIQPKAEADAANYPKLKDSVTDQLHQLIDGQIVEELRSGTFPQPNTIVARIRCVQGVLPQSALASEVTNVPVAMLLPGKEPAVAVAFYIFRGGVGAPDSLPFLEVFRSEQGGWQVVASTGADYAGSTFYVKQLAAPMNNEKWFLLWGRILGAASVGLRLEVVSFNGTAFRTRWQELGISGAHVEEVMPDHVIISRETKNEHGRAQEFRDRYNVVAEGLKRVDRSVTKSY